MGTVKGWVKFCQNLKAFIKGQNITNTHEGVNRLQTELTYIESMKNFVARIDGMNDQLAQFPPRDDGNS
eukprot:10991805-Ditylum_brightwellii.AAC.1